MTLKASTDPYHHGALRAALLDATAGLLAERGADGFSLREVARRAGVSAAAPAHHFGDASGLLTAVAEQGFTELADRLAAAQALGAQDARAGLCEQGLAYVRFALERPGLFRLMFRSGQLRDEPGLHLQGSRAHGVLVEGVARAAGAVGVGTGLAPPDPRVTALWALVHGYAHLAIAGKLAGPLAQPPAGQGAVPDPCASPTVQRPAPDPLLALRLVLWAVLDGLFPPPRPARTRAARKPP